MGLSLFSNKPTDPKPEQKAVVHPKPKDTKNHLKFGIPIKVVVIEGQADYCCNVWSAATVGFIHVMLGALLMIVFLYNTQMGDGHASFCTFGYFSMTEAILSYSFISGWSSPLRLKHRKLVHITLQTLGILCMATGTVVALGSYGVSHKFHTVIGMVAVLLMIVNYTIIGPFILKNGGKCRITHMLFGIITYCICSICVMTGLIDKRFYNWLGDSHYTVIILVVLLSFCVCFICFFVLKKCWLLIK